MIKKLFFSSFIRKKYDNTCKGKFSFCNMSLKITLYYGDYICIGSVQFLCHKSVAKTSSTLLFILLQRNGNASPLNICRTSREPSVQWHPEFLCSGIGRAIHPIEFVRRQLSGIDSFHGVGVYRIKPSGDANVMSLRQIAILLWDKRWSQLEYIGWINRISLRYYYRAYECINVSYTGKYGNPIILAINWMIIKIKYLN